MGVGVKLWSLKTSCADSHCNLKAFLSLSLSDERQGIERGLGLWLIQAMCLDMGRVEPPVMLSSGACSIPMVRSLYHRLNCSEDAKSESGARLRGRTTTRASKKGSEEGGGGVPLDQFAAYI